MFLRAWFYLSGYVIIMVKGSSVDSFLTALAQQRIYVWDTQKLSSDVLIAKLSANAFKTIRPIVRSLRVRVEIVRRMGLPFVWGRLLSRRMLVLGCGACLAAVYFLSSFIWFVRVDGAETIPPERVLALVREAGLSPGAPRAKVDSEVVVQYLMTHLDGLAWTGVELRGTLAVVRIVEKILPPENKSEPGDLVAAKDGIISHVVPFAGQVQVSEGETVARGQILISGTVPPGTIGPGGREMPSIPVRASGIVRARVWYEGYGEALHEITYAERTGKERTKVRIQVGSLYFTFGPAKPPFRRYTMVEEAKALHWRDTKLPVKYVKTTFFETEISKMKFEPEEAERIAVDRAWDDLAKALPEGVTILDQQVTVERDEDEKLTRAKVLVEILEDIAEFRRLENQD